MHRCNRSDEIPSREMLRKLKEKIKAADNYVFTEEEVAAAVKENKKLGKVKVNYARERMRLNHSLQVALSAGDESEAKSIRKKLEELEENEKARLESMQANQKYNLERINEKNKNLNLIAKKGKEKLGKVNGEMNPFARRPTLPRMNWFKVRILSILSFLTSSLQKSKENVEEKGNEGAQGEVDEVEPEKPKQLRISDALDSHDFDIFSPNAGAVVREKEQRTSNGFHTYQGT